MFRCIDKHDANLFHLATRVIVVYFLFGFVPLTELAKLTHSFRSSLHCIPPHRPIQGILRSSSYSVFIRCCPLSRDGQIHPISSAIARISSLHFARFRASSFKPVFSVFSICFFHVFFGSPRFLLPLTSRFRTLKTLSSSIFSIRPYHLTPFAIANRSIVFFNLSMPICSSVVFLSKIF